MDRKGKRAHSGAVVDLTVPNRLSCHSSFVVGFSDLSHSSIEKVVSIIQIACELD